MQMIFQDPYSSLNPKMTVYDIVAEPLRVHGYTDIDTKVESILKDCGLNVEEFGFRFPHELSGGQRQRVAIARALVLEPDFVVADEPTSMLDVSVRAGILELLLSFRERRGVTYLFITHDLALARYVTDRLAVMYLGKFMEAGSTESIISNPMHPYTQSLISSFPEPNPEFRKEKRIILKGEIPSPINIPSGCRFHPRCPYAKDICREKEPELVEISSGHLVACHMVARR
jgi:oligopeptide/dipeptide ABC transporter ATP-binding protein